MQIIEVSDVRQTPREMRPVTRAWPVARWWSYYVRLSFGLLYLAIMFAAWWFSSTEGFLWIVSCLGLSLYVPVAIGLIGNRRIGRASRAAPLGDVTSDWQFDDVGVRIRYPLGDQSLDWRAIVRVVEETDRLIFAVTPARNHVFPLRCFGPGQLDAFRSLLDAVRNSGRLGRGVD